MNGPKIRKISSKSFGNKKKVRIFAIANEEVVPLECGYAIL
jgi:hypothetical protein